MRVVLSALLWCCLAIGQERPNVLLIVSEDNGPELGCYGHPTARTPHLDALAAGGVRFQNAFVPYSVCSPSRAAYLTGLHPQQNGQIGLATHRFAMRRAFPNLASLLQKAGYRTGLIGKLHVNPAGAFPFDFRRFNGSNFGRRRVREFATAAREFFESGDAPFFLSINYPDAHFPLIRQQDGLPAHPSESAKPLPWVGCDSERLRQFTANYDNCLARLDSGIGWLLDALSASGHADNTLVIYIGDHGAQFSRGKTSCYDGGLRVPFLVRWPRHTVAGTVRDELVSTLDIVPTVCAAVGLEPPPGCTGRTLQSLLRGETPDVWRDRVYAMTTGAAPAIHCTQFAVRTKQFKLIHTPEAGALNLSAEAYRSRFNQHFAAGCSDAEIAAAPEPVRAAYARYLRPPRFELYDLTVDPYEWTNLADDPTHRGVVDALFADLQAFRLRIGDPLAEEASRVTFEREQAAARQHPYRREADFAWGRPGEPLQVDPPVGHHMVLPRGVTVPVRGSASPAARVAVRFAGREFATVADSSGRFAVRIGPFEASAEPRAIVVTCGSRRLNVLDVLVGDVWLCAGQSNMAFPLRRSAQGQRLAGPDMELPTLRLWDQRSTVHPGARSFDPGLLAGVTAETLYVSDGWLRSGPATAASFSAVAWWFGRDLVESGTCPIGLVHVAVGGSPMEAWIPEATLRGDVELAPFLEGWLDHRDYPQWCRDRARLNLKAWMDQGRSGVPHHPFEPGFLFAAACEPLLGFPIRGVLWYQGESNATVDGGTGAPVPFGKNEHKLRALVRGWREAWRRPELPFYIVQLPEMGRAWPTFRDVQRHVAATTENVEMIVAMGLGDSRDVHPVRKREVGERLALRIRAQIYGQDVNHRGPAYRGHEIEGPAMRIFFDHSAGLRSRHADGRVTGFEIAGADGEFRPAEAVIEGEAVVVRSATVPRPLTARYLWAPVPDWSLRGDGGVAGPFVTR